MKHLPIYAAAVVIGTLSTMLSYSPIAIREQEETAAKKSRKQRREIALLRKD